MYIISTISDQMYTYTHFKKKKKTSYYQLYCNNYCKRTYIFYGSSCKPTFIHTIYRSVFLSSWQRNNKVLTSNVRYFNLKKGNTYTNADINISFYCFFGIKTSYYYTWILTCFTEFFGSFSSYLTFIIFKLVYIIHMSSK